MASALQVLKKVFSLSDTHISVIIFTIGITLYTLTLRGVYGNIEARDIPQRLDQAARPFESSAERDRYALILSLVENRSFALSKEMIQAAYSDTGYYHGRVYIFFAPGVSLMAIPFYLIGKYFGIAQLATYFMESLLTSFTLVFLYKIARNVCKYPQWASLSAPLVYGFGSTAWGYAVTLYQHQFTV